MSVKAGPAHGHHRQVLEVMRRLCHTCLPDGSPPASIEIFDGGTICVHTCSPHHRDHLTQACQRIGWQVEQGRDRLTVLGWSPDALRHRIRLLQLACADLRASYTDHIQEAISLTAHLLACEPGVTESEAVQVACASMEQQSRWWILLEEVAGLSRAGGFGPQIGALLANVVEGETTLSLLCSQHLLGGRRAAEVLWRSTHAPCTPLTLSTARMAAWQEAMLVRDRATDGRAQPQQRSA
jgi:hypothetical protein